MLLDIVFRILILAAGFAVVGITLFSAVRTFVLPRNARDGLTVLVFRVMRRLFNLVTRKTLTVT